MARKYITEPVVTLTKGLFVLAVKTDTNFVVKNLSTNSAQYDHLVTAYNHFCAGLNNAFETGFGTDSFELHVFNETYVEAQQKLKASPYVAVSLDPSVKEPDAFSLGVSRHFQPGGIDLIGLDARPGFAPLLQQIENLKHYAGDKPVALIEDDIFSGFTMFQTVEKLKHHGINVKAIIPGIQIGSLAALNDNDLIIDPVHRYTGTPEQIKKIDLTDYRDFLLGVDGLVIEHGVNGKSRIPFVKPFTSPHIRISLPLVNEDSFSHDVWRLNAEFFEQTALSAGNMNPYAMAALRTVMPIDTGTAMRDIVRQISGI